MSDPVSMPPSHLFPHEAMNTTFHLRICEEDESTARSMARECFEHLDFLEARLSRFIDGSDVSRINQMQAGEILYISQSCHECLLIALAAHQQTGGLFDITLGRRIEHRKSAGPGPLPGLTGKIMIHPDVAAVTCEEHGREIDLGGIGKGFALDQLQQILTEWGAQGALLAAGASSLLAFGPQSWPVELAGSGASTRITLHNEALSASGTGIQGSHILHPAGDAALPVAPCDRVWVTAPTAALAEVWSTALMLLDPTDIADFIAGNRSIRSVHIDRCREIQTIPSKV